MGSPAFNQGRSRPWNVVSVSCMDEGVQRGSCSCYRTAVPYGLVHATARHLTVGADTLAR